jgi:integrase/recombinase XerD
MLLECVMSVQKLADRFVDYCAVERQLSEHTLQAYGYDLADFRKWLPAKTTIANIKTETLRAYVEDMGTRKLSASTVRRRVACLRAFFRFVEDEGGRADPFVGWRLKLPRRKRLPRALSRDETTMLLGSGSRSRAAKKARSQPISTEIRLMISTGIRVGELCKLQAGDLSHEGANLRVHGKGSRDRVVYVTDSALRTVLMKLAAQRQKQLGPTGPLFVNRKGGTLRPQSFRNELRSIAGEAGLKRRVTPHMLRHTAATLLIEGGVDIRIVQRLLGHSSIATTEIYTHVSDEALRSTLARANVLGGLGR